MAERMKIKKLTLEEFNTLIVKNWVNKTSDNGFNVVKMELVGTHERAMNIGHIYRVVFEVEGELWMNDVELDYTPGSDMYDDYIADSEDHGTLKFFPAISRTETMTIYELAS